MPRRLNSESFFYLNVRSRFNQKTQRQIPAIPTSFEPAAATGKLKSSLFGTVAALALLTCSIGQAQAQTQPQSPETKSNPAPVAATESADPALVSPEQQAAASAALTAGQQAYAAGDYATAEQQYRTAFAAVPSAQAQHGIAQSLDLQAKPTEAFEAFTELLARPDFAELSETDATHARERVEVLAQIPASVRLAVVSGDQLVSGAKVLLDGVEQTALELKLKGGSYRLQVLATGYQDYDQTLTVKPAQIVDFPIELQAVPAPAVAPEPVEAAPTAVERAPVEEPSKLPAYITLGVAGGAAIAGTIFGIKALSAEDRYDKSPTVAHADDVERNALIADMAFGVAFTLGITGIVLLLTDEPTEPGASATNETALQVVPYVGKDRGGAVARVTF